MKHDYFSEVKEVWKQRTYKGQQKGKSSINEVDFLNLGECWYFVFDIQKATCINVGGQPEKLIGVTEAQLLEHGLQVPQTMILEQDLADLVRFLQTWWNFFYTLPVSQRNNYKTNFTWRLRKPDGTIVRMLQQGLAFDLDEDGNCLQTLEVISDISKFGTEQPATFSIISLHTDEDKQANTLSNSRVELFSNQERKIIRMIAEGLMSKEIAEKLYISAYTVNTHRKNILRKSGCSNSAELVKLAVSQGLV